MLTPEQIAQFNRDGFLNGGHVLGDAAVEELRGELMRVIDNYDSLENKPALFRDLAANGRAPVWQIINIWEASDAYKTLMSNPKIVEEIAQLTHATQLRIWHDQIQYKPAETGGVLSWHQDAPLWPVLQPMTEVSAWVALDDVDESNGCMSMVPGSHLWGNNIELLQGLPDYEAMPTEHEGHPVRVVRCPVKKGEVHYHHALTWHGSHANTSGRPRRAIAFHYMTQDTRYNAKGWHDIQSYIDVADGELMSGAHFPQVYPAGV